MNKKLTMKQRVELYIFHRKCLGYTGRGIESALLNFAQFSDKKDPYAPLTISTATEWVLTSKQNSHKTWSGRIALIHKFAKYYQANDPKNEIPPANMFGSNRCRPEPYIYTKQEIFNLLEITKLLSPKDSLKPVTFKYLLGLLYSTGLRISEAIRLKREDVDLDKGILTIRETKHHKSRYVPVHETTREALYAYSLIRDEKERQPLTLQFFIIDGGQPLKLYQAESDFVWLRKKLGMIKKPRLYDFRHTFACERLLKWHQEGKNINEMMIYLSTYLGHAQITDTYWYLSATPELLSIVSTRFEDFLNSYEEVNHENKR